MTDGTRHPVQLILLPGMDGIGELFGDFVSALYPEFNTTIVQYPRDSIRSYPELLEVIRIACPRQERFVIVAELYSTPLAILLAAAPPRPSPE